jgi:hypothetical protein
MTPDNNQKDKRFSELLSTIEKGKVLPDKQFLTQLRDKSLEEFETYSAESEDQSPVERISIRRIIMKSGITKIAAAVVLIIAVLIGMHQFDGSVNGGGIAFGEVLEYFQTFSYTFDLTLTEQQGVEDFTMQAMVWELGRMRVDCAAGVGVGKISSISDFNTGKNLLLFHQNKTAVIKKESVLNKNTGAGGIVSFCTKPIENLWNLRDDAEEELGQKEINGQELIGFRVIQEDPYFEYDITIWANSKSGIPSLVKAIAKPLDASHSPIKWTMKNFDLDVELDEELFSLDLPTGYTLAYHEDLDKLEVATKPSAESKKIVQILELWADDRKEEAVQVLLKINWTEPITFGKEPYIFSISEKGYTSLKAEDQKRVNEEVTATMATVRKIVLEVLRLGQTAVSVKQYEEAENYFNAGLQLGKLLDNPNSMVIVRLVGIAIEKRALNEMISLYTKTTNQKKLQEAEKQLRAADAEADKIKKQATGR